MGGSLRGLAALGLALAAAYGWNHDIAGARTALVQVVAEQVATGSTTP